MRWRHNLYRDECLLPRNAPRHAAHSGPGNAAGNTRQPGCPRPCTPTRNAQARTGGTENRSSHSQTGAAPYWNMELIDMAQLDAHIAAAAPSQPQPELHLRVERTTQYEKVAQLMAAAQSGGLNKIGFITDPKGK